MRKKQLNSVALALFCFLFASAGFSYDVVLQDGKVVSGKLIFESDELIVLKDVNGILVNFKKSEIDVTQTAEKNKSNTDSKLQKPGKKGRVYTKEDLKKMPELSEFGSAPEGASQTQTQPQTQIQASEEEAAAPRSDADEKYWKSEALRLTEEIQYAENRFDDAKKICDQITPEPGTLIGTLEEFE